MSLRARACRGRSATGAIVLSLLLCVLCAGAPDEKPPEAGPDPEDGTSAEADAADATQDQEDVLPQDFLKDGQLQIDRVVKYFEDMYRSKSSISEVELTIVRPRRRRSLRMKIWTEGDDKALAVIQSPPREKGTATLRVDKNLWNYLPRIRRTIRIPPSMMLASWMGSDLTNDDLVRESSYSEDYQYELVGPSDDPDGWLIRFTAKEGVVGLWSRFDLVVSKDGRIPLESKWYDRKDRLARTLTWDHVKEFDGRRLPSHLTLTPEDKEGHRTEMTYLSIEFDVDLPEGTFSLTQLERRR